MSIIEHKPTNDSSRQSKRAAETRAMRRDQAAEIPPDDESDLEFDLNQSESAADQESSLRFHGDSVDLKHLPVNTSIKSELHTLPFGIPQEFGPYRIKRLCGSGGFSLVFQAVHQRTGRTVALKIPNMNVQSSYEMTERFLNEGKASARLDHPNIVKTYSADQFQGVPYIEYEFCSGKTLGQWLQEINGPLQSQMAAQVARDIAQAIVHSHDQGVLHRDLKPGNVLLFPKEMNSSSHSSTSRHSAVADHNRNDSFPFTAKLTDFGLAKILDQITELTRTSLMIGTPQYMAPEQVLGGEFEVDQRTDIYGIGALLYHLLTGEAPIPLDSTLGMVDHLRKHGAKTDALRNSNVPKDLQKICLNCLSFHADERYASATALAEDLNRFQQGEPIHGAKVNYGLRLKHLLNRPDWVTTAGTITKVIHMAVMLWVIFWIITIACKQELLPGILHSDVATFSYPVLIVHAFAVWCGGEIRKGTLWATIAAGLISGAMALGQALIVFDLITPPMPKIYDDLLARHLVFSLLAIIFGLLSMVCFLASYVLMNRKRKHAEITASIVNVKPADDIKFH